MTAKNDETRKELALWIESVPNSVLWSLLIVKDNIGNLFWGDVVLACQAGDVAYVRINQTIKPGGDK